MPLGSYCLNLVNKESAEDRDDLLLELKEDPETPGRSPDGHMWFCLTCIEDLYNGDGHDNKEICAKARSGWTEQPEGLLWHPPNGQIEAEWASRRQRAVQANCRRLASERDVEAELNGVGNSEPASQQQGTYETVGDELKGVENPGPGSAQPGTYQTPGVPNTRRQTSPEASFRLPLVSTLLDHPAHFIETYLNYRSLPNRNSLAIAPGLTPFAASLSSFIRPETRVYYNGFYTLDSYESFALMKWKNMCTRKTMWEIPNNRAFCAQNLNIMDDYDFVNFFGDDCLDQDEPKPRTVLSQILDVEPVSADDISTVKAAGPVSDTTGIRVLKPLSQIMTVVDKRVEEAWGLQDPTGLGRHIGPTWAHDDGQWPPLSFWRDNLVRKTRGKDREDQLRIIEQNKVTIRALEKAIARGD